MHPAQNDSSTGSQKVFIVDDHPIFRSGLRALLGEEDGLEVCGAATDVREALAKIEQLQPDLVLSDMNLPGESGLELIKKIKSRASWTKVIVISICDESFFAERVIRAGGQGFVSKTAAPKIMVAAIRHVLGGEIYLSPEISLRLLQSLLGQREEESAIRQLTDREIEVLGMLGQGLGTNEVAKSLHLSSKTIDAHRANIKAKLKLKTAAELICYAARWTVAQHDLSVSFSCDTTFP
jgi:DNA-binding NarL/FixJ family response regulator